MRQVLLDVIAGITGIAFAALILHNSGSATSILSTTFSGYSQALSTAGNTR